MADNISSPVTTGTILATDDIGGIHYPRTKISIGAYGSAADISTTNPMPVISDSNPAKDIIPAVPSDTTTIVARGVRCKSLTGVAGTLRITTSAGNVRNTEIDVGEILLINITRIHATGTTATGLEILV